MNLRIFYTRPDGGVTSVTPDPGFMARFPIEADGVAAVIARAVPTDATNVVIGTVRDLPNSRRFRNAWRCPDGGPPRVDMPLARVQRMNEVRAERAPKLAKSDQDYVRALEAGNTPLQTSLKAYRQKLRDLPATEQPNVDGITTPDALSLWTPTWPTDPTNP